MIFITGGTGLVGARMVYDLLIRGESLRLLKRSQSDLALFERMLQFYHGQDVASLLEKIEWVEGEITDSMLMQECVSGCDYCVHAAAMVSFHPRDRDQMRKINIQGTANIVNACLLQMDIKLLYVSSVAALGRTDYNGIYNEQSLWKDTPNNSGYAVSKYHAEMEVWRGVEEGLSAVMINPTIVLGAGSTAKSSGTLFGTILKGLVFYTDGLASLVDARDVSHAGLALLFGDQESERYVLSAGSLPFKEVFDLMATGLKKGGPTKRVSKSQMALAWRLMALKDVVFRTKSAVTRDTAQSAFARYQYQSAKIEEEIGMKFRPIEESIDYFATFFNGLEESDSNP